MRAYLSYFKLRVMTNLTYRTDAIAGIMTQIFFGLMFIMVYDAFYSSGSSYTMKWQELVNYLWLQQAFFSLIYPYEKDKELLEMIRNGNLSYELIRPQNFYLKWYIKMVSKKLVAVLLRFMPVLLLAIFLPEPFSISLPKSYMHLIIFVLALILGLLLITALNLLIHIITMFTIDEKGTMVMYGVVAEVFMGGTIPIPFFPDWLKKISNILPFHYIGDFPFRIYSGSISITEGYNLLLGSIIWIIVIIFIGYQVSNISLRKAVIQGG